MLLRRGFVVGGQRGTFCMFEPRRGRIDRKAG